MTGGGEAAAADRQLGGGDRDVTWPAGASPSRPRPAMSVHSNTPLVDCRRKSCILVKSVMWPHLRRMSIAVRKALSACGRGVSENSENSTYDSTTVVANSKSNEPARSKQHFKQHNFLEFFLCLYLVIYF